MIGEIFLIGFKKFYFFNYGISLNSIKEIFCGKLDFLCSEWRRPVVFIDKVMHIMHNSLVFSLLIYYMYFPVETWRY